jgi:hypothetical protein
VSLPGAAELFRSTVPGDQRDEPGGLPLARSVTARVTSPAVAAAIGEAVRRTATLRAVPAEASEPAAGPVAEAVAALDPAPVPDERLWVWLSPDLLLQLERVRGVLAREHALPVRRSEVVSAALTLLLDDFDAHEADSLLVRALSAD